MYTDESAFDTFLQTGRVDDYLEYCHSRKQQMLAEAKGAGLANATDHNRDYPAGYQNTRG